MSTEYKKDLKLHWRCAAGHEWQVAGGGVMNGTWCKVCAGLDRKTIAEVRELAAQKGGECLSDTYVNSTSKLRWRCRSGHEWDTSYKAVSRGHWCSACCTRKLAKNTLADANQVAIEKGGRCLSTNYKSNKSNLRWQCAAGHEWEASFKAVAGKNDTWCVVCAKHKKHTLEDVQQTAAQNGGTCLSSSYKSSTEKMRWRCAKGHEWESIYSTILHRKTWCPRCRTSASRPEKQLYSNTVSVMPEAINNARVFPGSRMELDIYIPSTNRGVEFDGHYWHSRPDAIERDARKDALCEANGIALMRVKEKEYKADPEAVTRQVIEFLKAA